MSKRKIQTIFTVFALLVFCFNIYEFFTADQSTKESVTILIECLAGIALIYLPFFARKLLKLDLPDPIIYFYWFFLFISVFLGTCLHLIRYISFFDKILHTVSPMLLTVLGYGLLAMLLRNIDLKKVSPWTFLIFGFAFAGVCGVFWEFWEFICDQVADMNLQRYRENGVDLIGRAALMDTMGDLFTNTFGALVMLLFAYIRSKQDRYYFDGYQIKRIKE